MEYYTFCMDKFKRKKSNGFWDAYESIFQKFIEHLKIVEKRVLICFFNMLSMSRLLYFSKKVSYKIFTNWICPIFNKYLEILF